MATEPQFDAPGGTPGLAPREGRRARRAPADGPRWVGIGAQRCGTTWLTELLCRHPDVGLAAGAKELHFFERFLAEPWTADAARRYGTLFRGAACPGEFTPSYLRSTWVAPLLHAACAPDTKLLVLLRDPVERFRSALRWASTRADAPRADGSRAWQRWVRRTGNVALWGGMYGAQLAAWTRHFDRARLLVLQYERLAADPERVVGAVWRALGLPPVPVETPRRPTWNSTSEGDWTAPQGVLDDVRELYRADVARLAEEWDVDLALWPGFA